LVVVDDAGRHAISLLGGHESGANELALWVGSQLGAQPVVTTASEILGQRRLVLGLGCSRGASAEAIEGLARETLLEAQASIESVAGIATIDLKRDEPGLDAYARRWHLPVHCFSAADLDAVQVPNPSAVVAQAIGTASVAEAAALLGAGAGSTLLVPKRKSAQVTAAVALIQAQGHLDVVGLGPGGREQLTFEAWEALRAANVIVGYRFYVDIVREWLPLAVYEALDLGEETERARRAIELTRAGQRVALVSSGDAGIYALAGLVFEELNGDASIDVRVIPGITAASSAAALLGAPLMADFAVISLSDLHVPATVILQRLQAAAAGDLVTVIYNPASQRRRILLTEMHRILSTYRTPDTPVGIVRHAYRPDQTVTVSPLKSLDLDAIDMFTV